MNDPMCRFRDEAEEVLALENMDAERLGRFFRGFYQQGLDSSVEDAVVRQLEHFESHCTEDKFVKKALRDMAEVVRNGRGEWLL